MGQMPTKSDTQPWQTCLGAAAKTLYPNTEYYAMHFLQELCSRIAKAELQNSFQASKYNFELDLTQPASLLSLPLGFNCLQSWKHQNIPWVDELSPGILLLFKSKLGSLRRDWGSLDHAGRVCCVCSTTSQQQILGSCLEGVWYQVRN